MRIPIYLSKNDINTLQLALYEAIRVLEGSTNQTRFMNMYRWMEEIRQSWNMMEGTDEK